MLALASDQLANSIFAGGSNGSGDANGGGDSPAGSAPLHIRRAVTRLGPNFVKIGQALASRPDLVGEAIAGELLLLQDAMPFFSHEIAREFIREVSPCFSAVDGALRLLVVQPYEKYRRSRWVATEKKTSCVGLRVRSVAQPGFVAGESIGYNRQ